MKNLIIVISILLNITLIILLLTSNKKQNINSKNINNTNNNVSISTIDITPTEIPLSFADELDRSIAYHNSDLMNNPIDNAYASLITDRKLPEIAIRELQVKYKEIWENEYDKALGLIKSKIDYQEDMDNIDKFDKYIRNYFSANKTFYETVVLGDYTDPSLPEKNSYGNGTSDKLIEIQGKIYRNACMQIITLLPYGEYTYPEKIDFELIE
jgi:hypothetical protein